MEDLRVETEHVYHRWCVTVWPRHIIHQNEQEEAEALLARFFAHQFMDQQVLCAFDAVGVGVVGFVGQLERASRTNNMHIQAYIELCSSISVDQIRRILPGHYIPAKGSRADNVMYCSKSSHGCVPEEHLACNTFDPEPLRIEATAYTDALARQEAGMTFGSGMVDQEEDFVAEVNSPQSRVQPQPGPIEGTAIAAQNTGSSLYWEVLVSQDEASTLFELVTNDPAGRFHAIREAPLLHGKHRFLLQLQRKSRVTAFRDCFAQLTTVEIEISQAAVFKSVAATDGDTGSTRDREFQSRFLQCCDMIHAGHSLTDVMRQVPNSYAFVNALQVVYKEHNEALFSSYEPPPRKEPQIVILWGPPGTGKSWMALEMISKYEEIERLAGRPPLRVYKLSSLSGGLNYWTNYDGQRILHADEVGINWCVSCTEFLQISSGGPPFNISDRHKLTKPTRISQCWLGDVELIIITSNIHWRGNAELGQPGWWPSAAQQHLDAVQSRLDAPGRIGVMLLTGHNFRNVEAVPVQWPLQVNWNTHDVSIRQ